MATCSKQTEVDNRVTCSVCLEPYSGRQPKILPCFHTFCLPCLSELAQASRSGGVAGTDEEAGSPAAPVTITCPACRTLLPVPPGGVAHFQSNFYIDDTCEQLQPSPCELCDGDQDASYGCSKCKNKFCSRCRRVHDKFCHSTQVTPIATTTVRSAHKIVTFEEKVQNQVKVIQSALKQLEEDAKEVSRQRQGIDDDLNICYAKGLRLLAEAHQACLRSLRDAAETVEGRLQAEIEAAKETHARLSKLSSKPQDASNQSGMQGAEIGLLSDADLQRFEEHAKSGNRCFLSHKSGELSTTSPDDCFKGFIGTVEIRERNLDETLDTALVVGEPSVTRLSLHDGNSMTVSTGNSGDHAQGDDHAKNSESSDVFKKIDSLTKKVAGFEQTISLLQSELTTLKQKNVDLSSDYFTLCREVSSQKDAVKLFERAQTYIKDKNSLLCQDVAALQGQNQKLNGDVVSLQEQNQKLSGDVVSLQGQNQKLSGDVVSLQGQNQKLSGDVVSLQGQNQKLSGDVASLQGQNQKLSGDVASMQTDHHQVASKVTRVEKDLGDLKKQVKSDGSQLKGDLTSLRTSVKQHYTALDSVQLQLAKAKRQVAFQALLHTNVTVKTQRVLILKDDIINIGGGYDPDTGYFTAPVSGMYMFMATSASCEKGVWARLDLVHEGEDLAHLFAGEDSCTCHAAVKVVVGERVWLRTFKPDGDGGNTVYRYSAAWMTSFSGVLVQPDL